MGKRCICTNVGLKKADRKSFMKKSVKIMRKALFLHSRKTACRQTYDWLRWEIPVGHRINPENGKENAR